MTDQEQELVEDCRERERQVRVRAREITEGLDLSAHDLTRRQDWAIRTGVESMLRHDSKHEIKRLEIHPSKYWVSVAVEVGREGDEGTLLEVVGRASAHLFVGPRGGVQLVIRHAKHPRRIRAHQLDYEVLRERVRADKRTRARADKKAAETE